MPACRFCTHSEITPFLDLGHTPLADQFLAKGNFQETQYPLVVGKCNNCSLVQLTDVVDREILYQRDYPYESSTTRRGRQHFHQFAKSVVEQFSLNENDLVVDIGSNVGVLLEGFLSESVQILGVDPAHNIASIATKNNIPTINEFFSLELAEELVNKYGTATVITSTNCFAHIDDTHSLMDGIEVLLDINGVFIIEAPYLLSLLENTAYDTIYHEHLSYLSLKPLVTFLKKHGFEIFSVQHQEIHGGSLRIFVARVGTKKVSMDVGLFLRREIDFKIHSDENLKLWAQKVSSNRRDLIQLLDRLKKSGKKIAAVSAPAKGMTLLNYCNVGADYLEFVTEKSKLKIGKFTPGTHLPVLPDQALIDHGVDFALLLAWNFQEEIIENLSQFRSRGGQFIIPIPTPVII